MHAVQTGMPQPLLFSQSESGFAFVSERCLEQVLTERGKEVPEGDDDEEMHRGTVLKIACLAAVTPDLTDLQVTARLNKAFLVENPDGYKDLYVEPDMLSDVVDKTDAAKVAEFAAKSEKLKASKNLMVHTRKKTIPKYFAVTPAPKYAAKDKKPPRWLPKKDEESTLKVTQWIEKFMPDDIVVECDDYNGRWRVISSDLEWKSISWTKRGYEQAAA